MRDTHARGAGRPARVRTLARLGLALAFVLGASSGCGGDQEADVDAAAAPFAWPSGPHPTVTLHVEGQGDVMLELYPELAPETVANFLRLARDGFYDGTTFHRVIPGFMIQGGDPNSRDRDPRNDGRGGPGYSIPDEPSPAPHTRGAVSMANDGRPDSGGSQFFIVHEDARHLDGQHTVFGRVIDGMAVVDAITAVEVDEHGRWGARNRPIENVVVSRVTVAPVGGTADVEQGGPASPQG
jgi:peptidyl-prolyl cis-trans isomerase B (cyclophilin B)